MKIDLLYNPTAGTGTEIDEILQLLAEAGHRARHRSSKGKWRDLLQDSGKLLVAAGGDGTVRKVALGAADTGRPFAILPVGTANNIAKSLEIVGTTREVIDSWSTDGDGLPFDIGTASASWGRTRFVESFGGGLFADLLARASQIGAGHELVGREMDQALHVLLEELRDARPARWRLEVDGEDLSGEYLVVEILNIRFAGPNVLLDPDASPTDGIFDVVTIGEPERHDFEHYLQERLHLASGNIPRHTVRRGRRIRLVPPPGSRLRVDDRLWPKRPIDTPSWVRVECRPSAARLVGVSERSRETRREQRPRDEEPAPALPSR
ncbi:MAG TPA: diacylglycerol kinase family protein [Candidatus Limnocylindria bacterium]|nr:diacylglycerol kinase family protein [Candidatus Limnocylindria bacterium]